MTNGLERLRQLRKAVPETPPDGADTRLVRPVPPVRTEPEVDDPAKRLAKPLPPIRKADGLTSGKLPQSFFDDLRKEREECRQREIAQYRDKVRKGHHKPRQKKPDNCSRPFGTWILEQWRQPGPVGDLVRAFYLLPDDSDFDYWQMRLEAVGAKKAHLKGLKRAQAQWLKECRLPAT